MIREETKINIFITQLEFTLEYKLAEHTDSFFKSVLYDLIYVVSQESLICSVVDAMLALIII